jgi:hypothetical protein
MAERLVASLKEFFDQEAESEWLLEVERRSAELMRVRLKAYPQTRY